MSKTKIIFERIREEQQYDEYVEMVSRERSPKKKKETSTVTLTLTSLFKSFGESLKPEK